jgi:hypothetical protein
MVLAIAHHLPKKEYKEVGVNDILLILSILVAYYRFKI